MPSVLPHDVEAPVSVRDDWDDPPPVLTKKTIDAACDRARRYLQQHVRPKYCVVWPDPVEVALTQTRSGGWFMVGKICPHRMPDYWETWLQPTTNRVQVRGKPVNPAAGLAPYQRRKG